MFAFIIEQNDEIKETFGYEVPFNDATQQSIAQYTRANYGPDAMVRNMTSEEKANFTSQDRDSFGTNW
jgi:hypothetical protein